jgi:hypothetical protein
MINQQIFMISPPLIRSEQHYFTIYTYIYILPYKQYFNKAPADLKSREMFPLVWYLPSERLPRVQDLLQSEYIQAEQQNGMYNCRVL